MKYFNVLPLFDDVILPTNSVDSAGYDLYSRKAGCIPGNGMLKMDLGFEAEFDPRYVALFFDKSSIGLQGIGKLAGVIEGSYRGEWSVILKNHRSLDYNFKVGQKIVQVIFVEHGLCPVKVVDKLRPSLRGKGGWGSTGSMKEAASNGLKHILSMIPEGSPLEVTLKTKLENLGMVNRVPDMYLWSRDVKFAVNDYLDSLILGQGSLRVPDVLV